MVATITALVVGKSVLVPDALPFLRRMSFSIKSWTFHLIHRPLWLKLVADFK
jgi:hypothetical protein